jgi:hypothetical protein
MCAHNSSGAIRGFGIGRVPKPDSAFAPEQWTAFYGWEGEDSALVWAVTDTLSAPPPDWDSTNIIYPSPFEIQPGASNTFRTVSRRPPTTEPTVAFYAQGFRPIPEEGEYSTGDAGDEDFPTLFRAGVTGLVYGPDIRSIVGVSETPAPGMTTLATPSPNPASSLSAVAYSLVEPSDVRLAVFDVQGRMVRVLAKGRRPVGYHTSTWDVLDERGRKVAAGVYFLRLEVNGQEVTSKKVTVLR